MCSVVISDAFGAGGDSGVSQWPLYCSTPPGKGAEKLANLDALISVKIDNVGEW